ncbi:MAG: hypothetical protein R3296_13475 [Oleiphilaceae bacterium]|nr:hypothetical protein [Oleiphilaceae bacterium]
MSDSRQFLIVMIVATLFATWLGWRGVTVINLNNAIQSNEQLAAYPYPFRVLRVEGQTAVMSTLRSPSVATGEAMKTLFPSLANHQPHSRELQRVEREFARLQALASEVVLERAAVRRVRWELDENWYYLNGMALKRRHAVTVHNSAVTGENPPWFAAGH